MVKPGALAHVRGLVQIWLHEQCLYYHNYSAMSDVMLWCGACMSPSLLSVEHNDVNFSSYASSSAGAARLTDMMRKRMTLSLRPLMRTRAVDVTTPPPIGPDCSLASC